ncbi:MAG: DUF4250 domain-containing protein [Firmicutes bacterium]|nr:DUF4250 domain-containing protein [Bacillota bacterium]MCM1401761.1 DUF4250 domain-containing protein [Bacteroides sp.]MCM1478009.1 DUF4250 domain-containing protein [Bacteroides sp.]
MEQLPSDPAILLSFLNMKLRDFYDTPEALCREMDIDPDEFNSYIASKGISYFPEGHRFVLD